MSIKVGNIVRVTDSWWYGHTVVRDTEAVVIGIDNDKTAPIIVDFLTSDPAYHAWHFDNWELEVVSDEA